MSPVETGQTREWQGVPGHQRLRLAISLLRRVKHPACRAGVAEQHHGVKPLRVCAQQLTAEGFAFGVSPRREQTAGVREQDVGIVSLVFHDGGHAGIASPVGPDRVWRAGQVLEIDFMGNRMPCLDGCDP